MNQKLNLWQTVFLVMVFTRILPVSRAIDPGHARAAADFRSCAALAGLSGIVWVVYLKRKLVTEPAADEVTAVIAGEPVIQVTYDSTRADAWRCAHFMLLRDWRLWCYFVVCGTISAFWMSSSVNRAHLILSVILFPLFVTAGVAAWIAFAYLLCWITYKRRFPTPETQCICTSSLTARGFHDAMPDRNSHVAWQQVHAVRMHNGDIFFLSATVGKGHFIPRTAFPDEAAAARFFAAAVTLWKSNGAVWPGDSA